jgi:hypothetical protein
MINFDVKARNSVGQVQDRCTACTSNTTSCKSIIKIEVKVVLNWVRVHGSVSTASWARSQRAATPNPWPALWRGQQWRAEYKLVGGHRHLRGHGGRQKPCIAAKHCSRTHQVVRLSSVHTDPCARIREYESVYTELQPKQAHKGQN